jgi:uncharacterized protein YaiL (DUF2058 family)
MSKVSATKFIVFAIILSFFATVCEAQSYNKPAMLKPGNGLNSKSSAKKKTMNIKGPVSVKNAKEKAAKKDKERKKEGAKYVKENQKRSIEIQTPEVKARMKQNIKDADSNYNVKHKKSAHRTRKAGRKYR